MDVYPGTQRGKAAERASAQPGRRVLALLGASGRTESWPGLRMGRRGDELEASVVLVAYRKNSHGTT